MTETNGHTATRLGKAQRRLEHLRLKQQLAEARIRLARAERQAKAEELKTAHWWPQDQNAGRQQLQENLRRKRDYQAELLEAQAAGKVLSEQGYWGDWVGGYQDMLDRLRSPDGLLLSAISIAADRRYGACWPFFRTWQELALLRGASRVLYQTSALARGAVQGLTSYIIGDGFTYRAVAKPGCPPGLRLAVQDLLDENSELNDWPALEAECLRRDVRDGEWFLRDFPQQNGTTCTRTVGPEQLIQPADSTLEEWSFGKKNPVGREHDVQTTLAYYVCYDGINTNGEEVPASEMIEHLSNVDRDVKRGIPDLSYDTYDFLKVAGRLIENMGEGSAIQAAVSEIRQWEGPVTGDQASDFVAANTDYTVPNPWTGTQENVRQVRPGEVRDIPKGMTYIPPPFTQGSPVFIQVEQAILRAVAVNWNAPEWLTSGDSSNNSYASSLTAESPFVRTGQHKQNVVYKPRFLTAKWRVLENYCKARRGIFVKGTLYDWKVIRQYIDIQCEPPSMEVRNRADEAQANATRIEGGWKSRQTCASEEGLDWENEKRNMKAYEKEFPETAPSTQLDLPSGKPGPEVPKPPHPMTEGKDAAGHEHDTGTGQFTSGGGGGGGSKDSGKKERPKASAKQHLVDKAEVNASGAYRVMNGLLARMEKGEYDPADVKQDVETYHEQLMGANRAVYGNYYRGLEQQAREQYGDEALSSPEWQAVKGAVAGARDDMAEKLEGMTQVVRYWAQSAAEGNRVPSHAREELPDLHQEAVKMGHEGFHDIADAVDAFKASHKPVPKPPHPSHGD